MKIIEIQILNNKTIKLLRDLEDLQLLKIVRRSKKRTKKQSEQLSGSLPLSVAEEMQKNIAESRKEWNRVI